MKKILILNPFGIGDVLFTTPFIAALKENFAESFIGYICNVRTQPLLVNNPAIDKIWIFEKDEYRSLWKNSKIDFLKKLKGFLSEIKNEHFDVVFDFSLNSQYSFFLMFLGIPKRIGYDFKGRGRFLTSKVEIDGYSNRHMVEYYNLLLESLGDFHSKAGENLSVYLSEQEKKEARDFLQDKEIKQGDLVIGFAPAGGASWGEQAPYKHWSYENFAKLADILISKHDAKIIIFGTRNETDICQEMANSMSFNATNLCGQTDLRQFAGLLSECNLLICNDGGPLHLSVAVETKTVSVFGPVDEIVYGPYPPSPNHIVIKADVECRPCYEKFRFNEKCNNQICLNSINFDETIKAAQQLLKLKND